MLFSTYNSSMLLYLIHSLASKNPQLISSVYLGC